MDRLTSGASLAIWHDGSGHDRHLVQWSHGFRPVWSRGAVAFGGDDYLASLLPESLRLREFTVFVVAAPEVPEGDFPGMLSLAGRDGNDFTSGLTMDFGSHVGSEGFAPAVNVEGAGQSEERNLLSEPIAARTGHLFTVLGAPGETGLRVNGTPHGSRDRATYEFGIDRIAVGARFVEPEMRHFYTGRLADVLVFGRLLGPAEIERVEEWLARKHADLLSLDPDAPQETALVPAANPPIVQMLVPGFTVEELPIRVTNLNNIEYAPDGRLFAGGYDGRYHMLTDTNGDGVEDRIQTFWSKTSENYPLGMVVKDGMPHALLSDEIIRFRDTTGDGLPDLRETVVGGWDLPELRDDPNLMHRRVDSAIGLAAGPDDSRYVTMGSANPGNPYWQDVTDDPFALDSSRSGPARYSPDKRRGVLLRLSPDGSVEQLASGLRYVVSLQVDPRGELFGTDQEGATWMPNGNPFDELLHLQEGRHYGFPPRHPVLLPDVVDEPSVWNYTPQHQSACGFRFNGPSEGRGLFGPAFWAHDAIVTGEARGKLWRTTLAKTPDGYVAMNQVIARLGMLAIDCAISPEGDLVVVCHSGPPDWGSGPSHEGRIFKIRYSEPSVSQPVRTWAVDERTTVIQFDRRLDESEWRDLGKRIRVEGGRFVDAADRLEIMRPGYAAVQAELSAPRYRLPVKSASIGEDGQSIVLKTGPRTEAVRYAITIDRPPREAGLSPMDAIDLAHELTGLDAAWRGDDGSEWSGWLPHPEFSAVRVFTRGSAPHSDFRELLDWPGKLFLRTKLELSHLLQPALQPGSRLDYTPEPEVVTVTFQSDAEITIRGPLKVTRESEGRVSFTRTIRGDPWQDLVIELATPASQLEVTFTTAIDSTPRPLGTRRFHMPFVTPAIATEEESSIPEIAGGDYELGRALFHGKASCYTCHQFNGQGYSVGPDLSNSVYRDYASLMRDIADPNASINPDAVTYQVELKKGSTVSGIRVGETEEHLRLALPGGNVTAVQKADIRGTKILPVPLMPVGLLNSLTDQEVKDLLTFLLTPRSE